MPSHAVRDDVAHTARAIARARARETARGDLALVVDRYAEAFADGSSSFTNDDSSTSTTTPSTRTSRRRRIADDDRVDDIDRDRGRLAVRTKFFDDAIVDACARARNGASSTQVVVVGAGLDSRAWRLTPKRRARDDVQANVVVFEIDDERVLRGKRALAKKVDEALGRQSGMEFASRREECYANIERDDWFGALERSGFQRNAHTVWVLEGLLYYLTERAVREVISRAASSSAPGSTLVASVVNAAAVKRAKAATFLTKIKRALGFARTPAKARWKSSCEEPETYFAPWRVDVVAQPGDERCSYGRWTGAPPPARESINDARIDTIPRTYYVIATL